jgi:hypothetical protein
MDGHPRGPRTTGQNPAYRLTHHHRTPPDLSGRGPPSTVPEVGGRERGGAGRRAAAWLLVLVGATMLGGSCGTIDEIREVFDTTPDGEGDQVEATTTIALFALGSRFPMPETRVVDNQVVYVLDPAITPYEPPPEPVAGSPNVGRGSQGARPATTSPDVTGTSAPEAVEVTGPLTQLRVELTPGANVRDIEAVRAVIKPLLGDDAVAGEYSAAESRALLALLYEDDPAFVDGLTAVPVSPVVFLAHRWPAEDPTRGTILDDLASLDGVDTVAVVTRPGRLHRSEIRLDVGPDAPQAVVTRGSRTPSSGGVALREGQRLVLADEDGDIIASTPVPAGLTLHGPLLVRDISGDEDAGDRPLEIVLGPEPQAPRSDTCRSADRQLSVELRVCTYRVDAVGVEVRTGRGSWAPLVGTPALPRVWRNDPPPGASPPDATWTHVDLSPDATRALVQWGGSCTTEAAALVDLATAELRWFETSFSNPWGPGSRSAGWTSDGRALVYLGDDGCPGEAREPGLYILDEDDDPVLLLAPHPLPGTRVDVTRWVLDRG